MWNKVPKNEYHKGKPGKKKDPFKKDIIFDPKGQWAHPGEITKIPSGNITMQGVPYPVLGIDNYGNEQMMYPGMDYQFPGNIVTEYPQMLTGGVLQPGGGGRWLDSVNAQFNNQYGGDPSIPELDQAKKGGWLNKYSKMPKKKSSKNIKTSINKLMVKNPLFERNYMLYGAKGPRLYDPSSKYQTGGQREPIVVFDLNDPRLKAYSDSLVLNNYSELGVKKLNQSRSSAQFNPYWQNTPPEVNNAFKRLRNPKPERIIERTYPGDSYPSGVYYYKNPVQPVVYQKPKPKPTPTPAPPAPKPPAPAAQPKASTPVEQPKPTEPSTKYAYMPTNWGPTYYYEWDSQQKKWIPISQQSYNYNTEGGTKNTQLYSSTPPGFKKGGWLDSYQEGGVTINSEEEYKKSLLMKNKTKERMDAERAWASKKVAAANAAKAKKPAPSAQQLFGIQPVAAESTGVNKTPQAGLDLKNKTALGFHKAVQERVKANPNLSIEDAQSQLNAEWLYATGNAKGQGAVRQADPEQGLLSKTVEVVSHPFNALDAYVQSGYVPDYFSHNKDAVNPMDVAYSFTPAGWYTQGADALYNDLPTDIEQGNWMGAANDLLMGLPLGVKAAQLGRTYIPQTYKINPWAFKPQEGMMYRGLGEEGFKDAVQSGVFRPKQLNYAPGRSLSERASSPKQFGSTYYAPSKKFGVIENYGPEYIAEVPYNEADFFRRYSKRNDWSYSTPRQIPITEGRILQKDWLRGYKPVDVPTQLPGSPNNIVPKTPPNPALGNPMGTVDDLKNINSNIKELRNPETGQIVYRLEREDYPFGNDWETMAPKDFTDYSNPWINKYYSTSGGYSDIPQFNQQIQGFNTQMQFGKQPLIESAQIVTRADEIPGIMKLQTELGRDMVPWFDFTNPMDFRRHTLGRMLQENKLSSSPGVYKSYTPNPLPPKGRFSGYDAFQQIHPNKYGGAPRKSGKKLVNYSQNPNFVKTSWLDKYK